MSFGFGFGFTKITAAIRAAFSPSSLFANNEPGVWYDPSDFSTMFQDAAGTVPVTAVEQPVGLMLDKSKGLGPERVTNGDFSNGTTGWVAGPVGSGVTLSVVNQRLRITKTSTSSFGSAAQQITGLTATKHYKISANGHVGTAQVRLLVGSAPESGTIYSGAQSATDIAPVLYVTGITSLWVTLLAYGGNGTYAEFDNISVRELPGNHASQPTATSRPVLSARVNQYLATETLATQNITTLAAQYRLRFEGTGTITLSGTATGVYSAGSHLITCTAGTLTSTVSGSVTKADLRVANTGVNLPPYQRVNTATDYDTAGFPHYLRFDGVDDWLVTPTITPGIDKAQVFAGARKLSDAAYSVIVDLSVNPDTNAGTFSLGANTSVGDASRRTWGSFISRTNLSGVGARTYVSPVTSVLSSQMSFAEATQSTQNIMKVDGAAPTISENSSGGVAGTGNFLAYPLYIGRRGGTTLPFNGHIYGLIVRFGTNLPAATIEKTEKYINSKTRAY